MKNIIPKLVGSYLNILSFLSPGYAARKGFELFCSPSQKPLKDYQRNFLNEAKSFEFQYKDLTIQSYKWGSGAKKVLFIHGWNSHTYRWKPYLTYFPPDEYTLLAIDAPAHGLSGGKLNNVPLYSQVIDIYLKKIGPLQGIICHSMGCFATLYSLSKNPQSDVKNLVLLAPAAEAYEFFEYYAKMLFLSDRTKRMIVDHFMKHFNRAPEYYSAKKFAEKINLPTLIIHDHSDQVIPVKHAFDIQKAINGHLITTEKLGHRLLHDKIYEIVADFTAEKTVFKPREEIQIS